MQTHKKLSYISLIWSLLMVDVFSVQAQGTGSEKLALTIASNRQKLFNKRKNPKISCEEMKKNLIATFSKSGKSLKDLDSLADAQIRKYLKCPQTKWESVLERSAIELYKDQIVLGMNRLAIPMPQK